MATFEDETENVREWASGFAGAEQLAWIHRNLPGFGEVWTQWEAMDAALAAAREPFDPERPHARGWARVMAAAQDLVASLPRERGEEDREG